MPIQTLSLWQPWASLLAYGAKRIETRSWPYRGKLPVVLAVHAAKRFEPAQRLLCEKEPHHAALQALGWYERPIPLGCVVGLVRLAECAHTGTFSGGDPRWVVKLADQEKAFGDFSPDRYGWICDRFHPLPGSLALRGMQGVFAWYAPAEVLTLAEALLKGE